jgi:hypothetical protein
MNGQDEALIFLLLFIIGIALFTTATVWSKGIFQQNVDFARVESAEKFIKDLNDAVSNIIKFGGSQEIKYNLDGTIELNTTSNNTIEIKISSVKIPLSANWIIISNDTSYIQEKLEGDILRIQLVYPQSNYKVQFFTEGSRLAMPSYVLFERNQTYKVSGLTVIKIKVTLA